MAENHQEMYQRAAELLLNRIKRESSALDLYSRLASAAPNQKHKNQILYALEGKKVHLKQFTDLYFMLTGREPVYEMDTIPFHNYRDGLKKAYQAGSAGYRDYQNSYLLTQHPQIRNVLLWVLTSEQENAKRFESLKKEVLDGIKDYGKEPFVVNIDEVTKRNNTYRTALWTGNNLQVTLMSINVGDDIGLEVHPTIDQFIRIEEGQALVQMGDSKDQLDFEEEAYDDYAIMIPAGKWHNVINTGNTSLKLYAIYAPPEHPFGTVHKTKADAMASEENEYD
ncbi:cupin domain-containing protein [Bacillus taeanensis]|uniref:Cupin domain-containing protein n=2 Tax=Bacillus taeanensis TaxID=273032 RepID=A0A366XW21_9BACI|nr:cupin domain-containing protein [Bacillus taeanensis]